MMSLYHLLSVINVGVLRAPLCILDNWIVLANLSVKPLSYHVFLGGFDGKTKHLILISLSYLLTPS